MVDEILLYQIFGTLVLLAAGLGIMFGMGKAPSYEEQKRLIKESESS